MGLAPARSPREVDERSNGWCGCATGGSNWSVLKLPHAFFKPMMRIRFVVERLDLRVSRSAIERDRFAQRRIRFETKDASAGLARAPLQIGEEPSSKSEAARRRV